MPKPKWAKDLEEEMAEEPSKSEEIKEETSGKMRYYLAIDSPCLVISETAGEHIRRGEDLVTIVPAREVEFEPLGGEPQHGYFQTDNPSTQKVIEKSQSFNPSCVVRVKDENDARTKGGEWSQARILREQKERETAEAQAEEPVVS